MTKRLIHILILLANGTFVTAQHLAGMKKSGMQTHQEMIRTIPYLLYLPKDYDLDSAKRHHLVMFLHGSGESGSDLEKRF
ncbi:hypothetical protein [Mucilaginibacter pocheonensis]|uniref:Peptidase n=1 Tax=Mucilaginibacter pocheonensis TaxID=398050 RepID=A0ABU1TEL6_9SPHI|nr:hypothetical protein [Mucilaginibacter pocheonensis]MDR6943802.1 putative peptidase [Mucilaginibacter pocheonensis]